MKTRDDNVKYTTIKANIGWFVVQGIPNEDNSEIISLYKEPVIAWLIKTRKRNTYETSIYCFAEPITIHGYDDKSNIVLQRPDKTFTIPLSEDFENEKEVIEYLNYLNNK